MIEQQLVDVLLADTTVTGLIGVRLTPVVVIVDAGLPSLTYRRIGGKRDYALDGSYYRGEAIIQLTAWAETYSAAKTLIEAVRTCLDTYGDVTPGAIQLATLVDGEDDWVEAIAAYGCNLVATLIYEGEV